MTWDKFEDIIAWQKGQDLAEVVYKHFGKINDYSFKDQICRASVSISNNIAEGFDYGQPKTFAKYLRIALGSCAEVRSMVYLAKRLKFINEEQKIYLINLTITITKLIKGILRSLRF